MWLHWRVTLQYKAEHGAVTSHILLFSPLLIFIKFIVLGFDYRLDQAKDDTNWYS